MKKYATSLEEIQEAIDAEGISVILRRAGNYFDFISTDGDGDEPHTYYVMSPTEVPLENWITEAQNARRVFDANNDPIEGITR